MLYYNLIVDINPKKEDTATETKKKNTKKGAATSGGAKKKTAAKGGRVTVSTAGKAGAKAASKKAVSTQRKKRGSSPAVPFIWFALALFLGAVLFLNLLCNFDNRLASDPSAHWMGLVGYWISYGIFGVFGAAAFTLPLLLLNLAIHWKKFSENGVAAPKILCSILFLLMLAVVIHVFGALIPNDGYEFTAEELLYHGVRMTGGGVVGGLFAYLLYSLCHYVGTLILSFLALGGSLFYILGMTPEFLLGVLREKKQAKKERAAAYEEDVEEEEEEEEEEKAPQKAAPSPKRSSEKAKQDREEEEKDAPSPKKEDKDDRNAKKRSSNEESPMPRPRLDPGPEEDVFVPDAVNKKMAEASRDQKYANYEEFRSGLHAKQSAASNPSELYAERTLNVAGNRDSSIDPIFPKDTDARQTKKNAADARSFDLRRVFDDENGNPYPNSPTHAPLPPEEPIPPIEEAPKKTAAPKKAPVSSSATFTEADPEDSDFGLSSEEFEELEAQQGAGVPARRRTVQKKTAEESASALSEEELAAAEGRTPPPEYILPPISYLQKGQPMTAENMAELQDNMQALAATLKSFHVGISDNIRYSCGPTVTRYEITPAAGVRVRSITNLSDDIALSLRASGGIRIEAPIPGTNSVGIEVPNKTRSTIYLRDLIESKVFTEAKSKLTACLGAGIAGEPLVFDIAKMPHLLIAGTTGSGKSVCINCIVLSLLYKTTPRDVRLVMIDPKKVEFSIYKNIPHLMAPVVTAPKDAAGALQAAVEEMEHRFELFETVGVRDLKGYNAATADDPDMPELPHIVIIIDELADLMMTARDEVETAICRIAQKARAAGMHLIIGTQRPSADVVTGLIKANVPSRIAFAVKSQIDSRVILDHIGAEALTGRGDMLFVPIGSMRDTRVQGAFVDDKEVEQVCDFLRGTNGLAVYDEKFIAKLKELAAQCGNKGKGGGVSELPTAGEDGGDKSDNKYADAVRIAIEEKRVSTSLLQRKLEIGYSRAAKLVDRMQAEGIVSAPDGSKPRTILITPEEYIERFIDNAEGNGEEASQ